HGVFGQVPQHTRAAVRARPRGSDGEVTADAGDHAVLSAVEHGQLPVLTVGVPDHGNGYAVFALGTAADRSGIVDAQRPSLAVRCRQFTGFVLGIHTPSQRRPVRCVTDALSFRVDIADFGPVALRRFELARLTVVVEIGAARDLAGLDSGPDD